MWYAREDNAQNYVSDIVKQIEEYNGGKLV